MTVVPAGDRTALVICDQCGREDTTVDATSDGELVWPMVAQLGWTGSAFSTGPHRCPGCSSGTPPPPEPTARPRTHGASYDVRTLGPAAVITPLTDFDADLAESLRDDLMAAAATHPHVLVDLHAVEFLDSTALGLLVRGRQEARQHGATFDLSEPSRFVLTVLHTMRLEGVFRIFPDQQAALEVLGAPHPDSPALSDRPAD